MTVSFEKHPVVAHLDQTEPIDCPFGSVRRVVTAGRGGVANVHVVSVLRGLPHVHAGYDEVYYFLAGRGVLEIDGWREAIRPGSVAVIPAGAVHALWSDRDDTPLEFVIFGTPPMALDDPRARPQRPEDSDATA